MTMFMKAQKISPFHWQSLLMFKRRKQAQPMDFGGGAADAVMYAETRDSKTGGVINVYCAKTLKLKRSHNPKYECIRNQE